MRGGVIQAGGRQTVLRLPREPLRRRTWLTLRYVIVSLPVATAGFVFTVVTSVVGIVTVGLPIGR